MKFRKACRLSPALLLFALIFLQAASAFAERWSFAAFGDNRSFVEGYRNVLEAIKSDKPADPKFPAMEFVVGLGDIDPVDQTVRIYKEVIGTSATFIPVRGNHERPQDVRLILNELLPRQKTHVVLHDKESLTYYFDWKNIRMISIDQYASYAKRLDNPALLSWLEKAILSSKADHIFIACHEPFIPDDFHTDPFWSLLLKHTDKVRAVLCAHTHAYARRYIPDTYGGIHLINAGNAGNIGHSDLMNTFVQVSVDRRQVLFRAVQAPDKTTHFRVTDEWKASRPGQ